MEIDGGDFPFAHGRQAVAFAFGVGIGEVEPEVVTQHEAYGGTGKILVGAERDSYDDAALGHHQMEGLGVFVEDRDTEDFGAAVAVAVIHVGDGVDDGGRRFPRTEGWGCAACEVGTGAFGHGGEILREHYFRGA